MSSILQYLYQQSEEFRDSAEDINLRMDTVLNQITEICDRLDVIDIRLKDIEGRLTTGPSKFLKRRPHFLSSAQWYREYYNRKEAEKELAQQMYFKNVPHKVHPIAVNNPAFTDLLDRKALKEWPRAQYHTPGTVEYEAVQAEKKSKGGVRKYTGYKQKYF